MLEQEATLTGPGDANLTGGTINGTYTISGVTSISGGPVSFNTDVSVPTLYLSGGYASRGALSGSGDVTVTGLMDWTSGAMSGAGTTNLAPGAIATITPIHGQATTILARTLNNEGTVTCNDNSF